MRNVACRSEDSPKRCIARPGSHLRWRPGSGTERCETVGRRFLSALCRGDQRKEGELALRGDEILQALAGVIAERRCLPRFCCQFCCQTLQKRQMVSTRLRADPL